MESIAAANVAYETTNLREKLARYHGDVDGRGKVVVRILYYTGLSC